MRPTVWLEPGMLIIYGAALDTAAHKHHAIQLIWPSSNSTYQLNGNVGTGALLIDADVEHQLSMTSGWILLIEPLSHWGKALQEKLAGRSTCDIALQSSTIPSIPSSDDQPFPQLAPLFGQLGLGSYPDTFTSQPTDKRIQELVSQLDKCINGDCVKPSGWRAAKIAEQLALSESRFLHLFREQMGITWRPYLLWRRMFCALNALKNGNNATQAAYLAGFADSAHLSRTFKNQFGMTIRQALILFLLK
ncbi:AraC family transcriptional regulator [Shewanella eurypsychrophilus]|uniref:AraC family transcriptional regulator n=1 Tax=Shewanella eurypsychrophilus TaxID=2593656 RepID=A0ABX6V3Q7_9GAMM|nr:MULTISPECIES: AraC family transcriptional regulator [Shewanella]QFU21940.1 helix-turn-helix domain-containing protein [Shewanella sp. YLB-09]QPG57229.1 AraC family transcriptional regulator [Shewanella eurypsychrophilus]